MEQITEEKKLAAVQWLDFWQAWGKPMVSMPVSFLTTSDGYNYGQLNDSAIELHLVGDAFEHDGLWMQSYRIEAEGVNLSRLVGVLSGLPVADDCVFILCEEPWWQGMIHVAMAVLATHWNAASAMANVEAVRALDPFFAGQQVALLESNILESTLSDKSAAAADLPTPARRRRL